MATQMIEAQCGFEYEINDDGDLALCDFTGEVDADVYRDLRAWTCPNCYGRHEEEPDWDLRNDSMLDR